MVGPKSLGVVLCLWVSSPAFAQAPPAQTRTVNPLTDIIIVVNSAVPESVTIGNYYATRRGIPASQICTVTAVTTESCTWPQFRTTILAPVTAFLAGRPSVLYIVPIFGVPVKTTEENPANDIGGDFLTNRDYCAIDRELELIKSPAHVINGWILSTTFDQTTHVTLASNIYIVSRLDGPNAASVTALIDNAMAAEATGIGGNALLDTRGLTAAADPYTAIDQEMKNIAPEYTLYGIPFTHDDLPAVVDLATRPSQSHYWGWYTGNVVCSNPAWRFVVGAVGAHLHSFSASNMRSTTSTWTAPLVHHGITGTCGTVYEPYSVGFPFGTVFMDRFLNGFTFGEAMQMANAYTSWQAVFVGDPLYAPYAANVVAARIIQGASIDNGESRSGGDCSTGAEAGSPWMVMAILGLLLVRRNR